MPRNNIQMGQLREISFCEKDTDCIYFNEIGEERELLGILDEFWVVKAAIMAIAYLIILFVIFRLVYKRLDKPRSYWTIYWLTGIIFGFFLILGIMNQSTSVYVLYSKNFLLYGGIIYFLIVLSLFYFWYKKSKKPISYCVIFWILSIIFGYLLPNAIIFIIKCFLIIKSFFQMY